MRRRTRGCPDEAFKRAGATASKASVVARAFNLVEFLDVAPLYLFSRLHCIYIGAGIFVIFFGSFGVIYGTAQRCAQVRRTVQWQKRRRVEYACRADDESLNERMERMLKKC